MSNQSTAKAFSFEIVITLLITVIIAFYFAFPRAGQAEVETADSLSQKVMTLYHAGNHQAAFPIAKKVLRIRERGPHHHGVYGRHESIRKCHEVADRKRGPYG